MRIPMASIKPVLKYVIAGGLVGVFILHPLTMVIYWFEFHVQESFQHTFWTFITEPLVKAFRGEMIGMTLIFALIGGSLGLAAGLYHYLLSRRNRIINQLTDELSKDLGLLIEKGEGELIELKSSIRWDLKQGKVNKGLEDVILKTIAGFMNNRGGALLIGVNDDGEIVGLEHDYSTLKRKNRDGFEQHLINMISSQIGTALCPLVQIVFHKIDAEEVCRVIIKASPRPVYIQRGSEVLYFLRTGNTTRELNVREALAHIEQRWPKR